MLRIYGVLDIIIVKSSFSLSFIKFSLSFFFWLLKFLAFTSVNATFCKGGHI